jgi:hypothetical protein
MKPNVKSLAVSVSIVVCMIFAVALAAEVPRPPAADLKLAPDLSFSDDSSPNFPIEGKNLSDGSIALIARYYHGYIPTIAVIDHAGNVLYDRAGETASERGDTGNLQKLLDSAR